MSNSKHLFTALQLGGLALFYHFTKEGVVSVWLLATFGSQKQISVESL